MPDSDTPASTTFPWEALNDALDSADENSQRNAMVVLFNMPDQRAEKLLVDKCKNMESDKVANTIVEAMSNHETKKFAKKIIFRLTHELEYWPQSLYNAVASSTNLFREVFAELNISKRFWLHQSWRSQRNLWLNDIVYKRSAIGFLWFFILLPALLLSLLYFGFTYFAFELGSVNKGTDDSHEYDYFFRPSYDVEDLIAFIIIFQAYCAIVFTFGFRPAIGSPDFKFSSVSNALLIFAIYTVIVSPATIIVFANFGDEELLSLWGAISLSALMGGIVGISYFAATTIAGNRKTERVTYAIATIALLSMLLVSSLIESVWPSIGSILFFYFTPSVVSISAALAHWEWGAWSVAKIRKIRATHDEGQKSKLPWRTLGFATIICIGIVSYMVIFGKENRTPLQEIVVDKLPFEEQINANEVVKFESDASLPESKLLSLSTRTPEVNGWVCVNGRTVDDNGDGETEEFKNEENEELILWAANYHEADSRDYCQGTVLNDPKYFFEALLSRFRWSSFGAFALQMPAQHSEISFQLKIMELDVSN